MATLNIDGQSVTVDDSFLKLPHDQQHAAVDEIAQSLKNKPASFADRFDAAPKVDANPEALDHGLSERQKLSPVGKALSPITGYPATYERMRNDALDTASSGINQLTHPDSVIDPQAHGISDILTGAAKTAGGAIGYVASPISAAYRSVIGQPIEDTTGIPREYPEFAAQLATPGLGLAKLGNPAPVVSAAEKAAPSIADLKAAASANYESPALKGLEVKPANMSAFATKTKIALDDGGLDENLAPKTHAMLSKLEKVPDSAASTMAGNNIKSLRQLLGNAAGEPGTEGLAGKRALAALDEHIPTIDAGDVLKGDPLAASQALQTANADYSAAKHAETIDNKTIRAELRAAASNSGQNVANTVRQRMADILNPERPDLQRGFKQDELAAMEQIVRGTKTQNALRTASNYAGRLQGTAIGGVVGSIFGPAGAAVGVALPSTAGYAMKAIASKMTLGEAAKVSEMIRSRAPLASASQKFEVSAGQFAKAKSAKTFAGMMIAARNLSNNLRGSGINITTPDLLSGMQPAGAQDQEQVPGPAAQ